MPTFCHALTRLRARRMVGAKASQWRSNDANEGAFCCAAHAAIKRLIDGRLAAVRLDRRVDSSL